VRLGFRGSGEFSLKAQHAVNQSSINQKKLKEFTIPLPPIAEQKEIISRLDLFLGQVESIKKSIDGVPGILKKFRQSVLSAAVSGKLTEAWRGSAELFDWEEKIFNGIIDNLDQGWSSKCINTPSEELEWGVINTSSVQSIYFYKDENKTLPRELIVREKLSLKKDDILITRAGPRARCGITCIVNTDYPKLMICDKVYRIKVNLDHVLPQYFNFLLNSPTFLPYIEKIKTGTSENGMNLTQKKFKELKVFLPPLKEQKEIVRQVESFFALVDSIENKVKESQSRVDNMTQSILAKAFRGELTKKWREDNESLITGENSVAALMEKIRAERKKG